MINEGMMTRFIKLWLCMSMVVLMFLNCCFGNHNLLVIISLIGGAVGSFLWCKYL